MREPSAVPANLGDSGFRHRQTIPRSMVLSSLAAIVSALTYFALPADLDEAPRRMATIFVGALVLWVTEAVPLFATSLFVIVIQVWWLAMPTHLGMSIDYQEFFNSLSNPIIYLFLGGFILSKALQNEGMDTQMAAVLLKPFGKRPVVILAGVMVITAGLSMWMSNTAATTLMIALLIPIVNRIEAGDPFRKALILGVPLSANVGGIGTPIGSPPNAIALGEFHNRGLDVNFLQWMLFAVPLLAGTLLLIWGILVVLFPCRTKTINSAIIADMRLNRNRLIVYATFWITIGLWLTSPLHEVPNAVVAAIPIALLTLTRIVDRDDFNQLEWDVLALIAGGISLATGLRLTGLDAWLLEQLPLEHLPFWALAAVAATLSMALSTVMSNTVAANIVMPLAMTAAAVFAASEDTRVVGILVAMGASFAMALPISTPPNAIAYGTGMIAQRDLLIAGGLVSLAGTILIATTGPLVIRFVLALVE